jgi:hypothetical protein
MLPDKECGDRARLFRSRLFRFAGLRGRGLTAGPQWPASRSLSLGWPKARPEGSVVCNTAPTHVIPALSFVIPAKAGTQA